MVVQSGARSPELPSVNIGNLEAEKQNEQVEAAAQLNSLIDSLLEGVEPEEGTQDRYAVITKLAKNIDDAYMSIYVASVGDIEAQPDTDSEPLERIPRKYITLAKTRGGREKSALVYEFMSGEATRREEADGAPVGEAEAVSLSDIEDLEKLLGRGMGQDKFAA